jgi:hypothetical protein
MKCKEKVYKTGREIILNAICDMAEIQKGGDVFSDPENGSAGFVFESGGRGHEYLFTMEETESGINVKLLMRDATGEEMLDRAFFLLDSLLCDFTEVRPENGMGCAK